MKFFKTADSYTYLAPACHFISFTAHPDANTPCGYDLEPEEVAGQTFSSYAAGVTCERCQRWLAKEAEKALMKAAR